MLQSANLTYIPFGRSVTGERKNSLHADTAPDSSGIFAPRFWGKSRFMAGGPRIQHPSGKEVRPFVYGFLTSRRQWVVRNPLGGGFDNHYTRVNLMTKFTLQDESVRTSNFRSYQQDDKVFIFNKDGSLHAVYTLLWTDQDFQKKEVLQ